MDVSFGEWVRRARLSRGLTQADLARAASCAAITVRKIEADERRPSPSMLHGIARALDIDTDQLQSALRSGYATSPSPALGQALSALTPTARGSIPRPLHRLVGREVDLAALEAALTVHGGPARLVTITGPPGVGKTRLAVEACLRIAGEAEAAVYVVDLAGVANPDFVPERIAVAMGVAVPSEVAPEDAVADALAREPTLLVLDNADQVGNVVALLTRLLTTAPGLACLVTSRVRLDVYGEHVFDLAPLSTDDGAAAGLFAERARAVRRDIALPGAAVARVCRRLDGIPLALELAASRLRHLEVADLEVELESGLGVLQTTSSIGDDRHRTMTHAVEWSYARADAATQRLLRAASWLRGPLVPQHLSAMVGWPVDVVDAQLAHLAELGLIRRAGDHYRMYEVVRAVARERSADHGEVEDDRLALAGNLLDDLRRDEPSVIGLDDPARLARVAAHYDDLVASIDWCLDQPGRESIGKALLWQAGGYWLVRLVGHAAPIALADRALAGRDPSTPPDDLDGDRIRLLLGLLVIVSDPERGRALTAGVRASATDPRLRADAQRALVLFMMMSGDIPGAQLELEDNLRAYTSLGNDGGVGLAEMALGRVAAMAGDLSAFDAHLDRALDAFTRGAIPAGRANVLADKAEIAVLTGRNEQALPPLLEAEETLIAAGATWHAASYLAVAAAARADANPWLGGRITGLCLAWLEDLGLPPHPFSLAVLELAKARLATALGSDLESALEEGASLPRSIEEIRRLLASP